MSHADETSASQLSDGQAWDSMKSLLTDLLPVIDDLRFCIRGGEGGSDINAMENGLKKGLEICKDLAKLSSLSTALGNRQKKRLDELHGTEMCILTFQESQVGLKQTVSKLQDERDALSASIRNLEQQASSEEQKLQSLSSSLNRVRSENADLETRIASINNQQIRLSQVESALRVRENVVSEREEQAKTADAEKLLEDSMTITSDKFHLRKVKTQVQTDANCLDRCIRSLWSLVDLSNLSDIAVLPQSPTGLLQRATTLTSVVTEEIGQLRETQSIQSKEISSLRDELDQASRRHGEHKSELRTDLNIAQANLKKTEAVVSRQKRKLGELEVQENLTKRRVTTLEWEKTTVIRALESHGDITAQTCEFETQLQAAETRANNAEERYWQLENQLIQNRQTHLETLSAHRLSTAKLRETATKTAQALSKENDRLMTIDNQRSGLETKCRQELERIRAKEAELDKRRANEREIVAKALLVVEDDERRRGEQHEHADNESDQNADGD